MKRIARSGCFDDVDTIMPLLPVPPPSASVV